MAKSQKNQTFVLKINTGYLSKHNWHLTLKLNEIRKQSQLVVSLGSSQVLRWIEQFQGRQNNDAEATLIKQEIKQIKKQENIITSAIRDLCYGIAKLIGISEEFNVSVDYDDSIIEDTESVQRQALTEYNAKLISKAEYFRYVYKYDDKNALDFVRKMEEEIKVEQKALSNGEEPGYIE